MTRDNSEESGSSEKIARAKGEDLYAGMNSKILTHEKESLNDFTANKISTLDFLKNFITILSFAALALFLILILFFINARFDFLVIKSGENLINLFLVFLGGVFGLLIASIIGISGITRQHWRGKVEAGDTLIASLMSMLRGVDGGG